MMLAEFGFNDILDLFLHLDVHLNDWAARLGPWLYVVVFAIIFCETGLVVTPILPGDSLLFALGALAASEGSPLDVRWLIILMIIAAILGDAVNYAIGHYLGPKVFSSDKSWLLNKKHLEHAQNFYQRYGNQTIVICRFVPIVRTFGPFVAGIGKMEYRRFAIYNIFGAILWVVILTLFGYYFGGLPFVKKNFSWVVLAIVFVSVLPMLVTWVLERRRAKALAASKPLETSPPV